MSHMPVKTDIMTKGNQSSRWEYRAIVKNAARKKRRAEEKKVINNELKETG